LGLFTSCGGGAGARGVLAVVEAVL